MSKILDLNKISPLEQNLQDNLVRLGRTYGKKFIIKNDSIELHSKLYLSEGNHIEYFILKADVEKRYYPLYPFKIEFYDSVNKEFNNNCYIANIHRTDKFTGTQIMETILKFLKMIGVEIAYLYDGARVVCGNDEMDLSLFKLIEKGQTFYQKFGFQIDVPEWQILRYGNAKNAEKVLIKSLKKFREIKIKDLIDLYKKTIILLSYVIVEQDYKNLDIMIDHYDEPYYTRPEMVRERCIETIKELDQLLEIFQVTQHKFLYKLFVDTVSTNCATYKVLEDYVINNMIYSIVYKKKHIKFPYRDVIRDIVAIRSSRFYIRLN